MARVLFFGPAREIVGVEEKELRLTNAISIEGLWDLLEEQYPELAALRGSSRIAIDMQYAVASDLIADASEVAIIPPVAGG